LHSGKIQPEEGNTLFKTVLSHSISSGGFFRRLKRRACTCTRRDKLALHFLSLVQFAPVVDWMR